MIANCANCGKEIIIPDGWTLTADAWKQVYCQDCELGIKNKDVK